MENNKQRKLRETINILGKVAPITEGQKQQLLEKYYKMSDKEIIKDLAEKVYQVLGTDSPYYDYALEIIRNYNSDPSVCPPVDEMKAILEQMFLNQVEGNMSLEDNHKLINTSLTQVCMLLNQYGIDYYIVGALPCFLKTNQPLFRYHDDIDIMVNEDDIPKIAGIMEVIGYKFFDDRFPSKQRYDEMQQQKPPHTVLAQNPENEFHLGFFCFRREKDNSVTMREYSHRLENEEVVVDVVERLSDPIGTSLRYDETPITFNGVSFRTSSVESVYNLKSYTKRPKDITDMEKLEPYLDKNKLAMLTAHKTQPITIQNVEFPKPVNSQKSL